MKKLNILILSCGLSLANIALAEAHPIQEVTQKSPEPRLQSVDIVTNEIAHFESIKLQLEHRVYSDTAAEFRIENNAGISLYLDSGSELQTLKTGDSIHLKCEDNQGMQFFLHTQSDRYSQSFPVSVNCFEQLLIKPLNLKDE